MYGHSKDRGRQETGYGWLNPYFIRTGDGNTEKENYWILSETIMNEICKQITFQFYDMDFTKS